MGGESATLGQDHRAFRPTINSLSSGLGVWDSCYSTTTKTPGVGEGSIHLLSFRVRLFFIVYAQTTFLLT